MVGLLQKDEKEAACNEAGRVSLVLLFFGSALGVGETTRKPKPNGHASL